MIDNPEAAVMPIDAGIELPAAAGGKAHGLRHILRVGLPAPPAWCALPGAADGALRALADALARRGIRRVAVRSSAADEDGGAHSFAGIHETALSVPLRDLAGAVAVVAASALSDRARSYRTTLGLAPPDGPCAVVVQEMLDPDWAGVAFGRDGSVLVEAVEGHGEVAVNGEATPEAIELVPDGRRWRVIRRWPRQQRETLRAGPDGIARVPLRGTRPDLPTAVAVEIATGVAALERARGVPLDVEWAASAGNVAFLQARPQTRPLEVALAPGETWTRTNVSETFLADIGEEHAGRDHWRSRVPDPLFGRIEAWLERYGHRGPYGRCFPPDACRGRPPARPRPARLPRRVYTQRHFDGGDPRAEGEGARGAGRPHRAAGPVLRHFTAELRWA